MQKRERENTEKKYKNKKNRTGRRKETERKGENKNMSFCFHSWIHGRWH